MKAVKGLGAVLLILGVLALLAGLLAVTLPIIPLNELKGILNALQGRSDMLGSVLVWLFANGWLTLGAGAGLTVLGIVLLVLCARARRRQARREAEDQRKRLMEQNRSSAVQNVRTPYPEEHCTSSTPPAPTPAHARNAYVSPVPAVRTTNTPQQRQMEENPFIEQIAALRSTLHEQDRQVQPERIPAAQPNQTSEPQRNGKNPYVRPLSTQNEWKIAEMVTETHCNLYARPQTTVEYYDKKQIEPEGARATMAAAPQQHGEQRSLNSPLQKPQRLYAKHVAGEMTVPSAQSDSLLQRRGPAIPEIESCDPAPFCEEQCYMDQPEKVWNQPTDLTDAWAWNVPETSSQLLGEPCKVLPFQKESEQPDRVQMESASDMPQKEEQTTEVPSVSEMPDVRSRMGRRAALESEKRLVGDQQQDQVRSGRSDDPTDESVSQGLLFPASSRIKLTVGKHTADV